MKNKIVKIISSFLIIACMISCFAVFSFAAEGRTEELTGGRTESTILHLQRTFEEGWGVDNGFYANEENNPIFSVEREELADFSYNHYAQIETTNDDGCHFQLTYDKKPTSGGSILEFDLNIKDYCNFGNIMYLRTCGAAAGGTLATPLGIYENELQIFNFKVGTLNQGWMHIAYVMNFDQTEYICYDCDALHTFDEAFKVTANDGKDCTSCGSKYLFHRVKFRCYFSLSDTFDPDKAQNATGLSGKLSAEDLNNTYYFDYILKIGTPSDSQKWNIADMDFFRFGPGLGSHAGTTGQKIMFDNILLYSDPKTPEGEWMPFMEFEDDEYGTQVNTSKATTVDVGAGNTNADIINQGLVLKTNSINALFKGEKTNMEVPLLDGNGDPIEGMQAGGAPKKVDGVVYVPLDPIFSLTGYPRQWRTDGISCDISNDEGSAVLTIGRDVAIINGKRVQMSAPPVYLKAENGEDVYRAIAIDDIELIFTGWYVTYDTMGLIAICKAENVFDRYADLGSMMSLMKRFVFDYLTGEEFYYKVKENTNNFEHPYIIADQEQMDFMHNVWLYEDEQYQDEFYKDLLDRLVADGEKIYKSYTTTPSGPHVAKTKTKDYTVPDPGSNYKHLKFEVTNFLECGVTKGLWVNEKYDYGQFPHYEYEMSAEEIPDDYVGKHYNDGAEYEGGRCIAAQDVATEIQSIAVTYVITRDVKYAELLWEIILSFMKWRHWGQHQFLAVADVAYALGMAFDWLYNIWTELGYDTNMLAQAMYQKLIWFGYVVTVDMDQTEWYEDFSRQPGTTHYNHMTINWNVVCTGGLTIAELAIIGEQDPSGVDRKQGLAGDGNPYTEIDFTKTVRRDDLGGGEHIPGNTLNIFYYTMESNFRTMCEYGLDQYPPDGSFIESPGYWGYTTNNLARMTWALTTATGDDCGIFDFAGIDSTWYYAVHTEYPSDEYIKDMYVIYYYHDSGVGIQGTNLFFFASQHLGDESLAAIRIDHIKRGKDISWDDAFGYRPEYMNYSIDDVKLDCDYVLENLHGVVSRSDWNNGALFTAMLGDSNTSTAHAHVDCGSWMYANLNTTWFCDMGSEEYDLYQYFEAPTRYYYYRVSAEGHNSVIVTNLNDAMPNGQNLTGVGNFLYDEYISNEYGMKAILETTSLFSPYSNLMYRGLMLTNNRQTVVVQDQIGLKSSLNLAWIAHTKIGDVSLSGDGRTAYLKKQIDGLVRTLRVSIVEERATDLKFEIIDAGVNDFLLDSTHRAGYSASMGQNEREYSRLNAKRLVIKNDGAMNFNLAVVIELLPYGGDLNAPVQYDYVDMRDWVPVEKYTGKGGTSSDGSVDSGESSGEEIQNLSPKDIIKYANDCKRYIDTGFAFTTRTTEFFKCLARVNNGFNSLNIDRYKGVAAMETAYKNYTEYMKQYNAFREDINEKIYLDISLTRALLGVKDIESTIANEEQPAK